MIRFVDVRYQGLQARFAFWDTVTSRFFTYFDAQAFDRWEDFAEAFAATPHGQNHDLLARHRNLCPPWVFNPPTDEELDFPEERFSNRRFVAHVSCERREGGIVCVDGIHVFNTEEARDAFVAEFPEGRKAVEA